MPKKPISPIPDTDIDGVGDICFEVTIPDTLLWKRALYVAIGNFTKGRYWNEKTGSVLEAQQIGKRILNTLKPCDDDVECPPEIITIIEECNTMSNNLCCCNDNQPTLDAENQTDTILPDIDLEDPVPPPDFVTPTDIAFDDWKCKLAKHLVFLSILITGGLRDIIAISEENNAGESTPNWCFWVNGWRGIQRALTTRSD